jgi:hypothetical protein
MQYVGQKNAKYADCLPRAMVNACRFYDLPCPDPDSEAWEDVVDFAGCRHGTPVVSEEKLAECFGLRAKPIHSSLVVGKVPVLVTVINPEVGHSLHVVLIVGWAGMVATVLNYRVEEGEIVERVKLSAGEPPTRTDGDINRDLQWDAIYIPKPPNNRCFVLEPA